ncbi:hypothetical protein Srubr_20010 [Streptomyces rubradiris]|uniref:Uncharacterized protein n=1 Tax=Streptomyces rubradiris TaxID=285531 RepID=A0ABQ3R8H2_STRRR|nr:hypothetical protein [Streptomyces rubradiris]GHH23246.1 hypothetical protein GCM10018792_59750 [Streptomyces rubradiris]GHI52155.1 hypothetical protein Srubr_20010 [Streptomyces rubradiris]
MSVLTAPGATPPGCLAAHGVEAGGLDPLPGPGARTVRLAHADANRGEARPGERLTTDQSPGIAACWCVAMSYARLRAGAVEERGISRTTAWAGSARRTTGTAGSAEEACRAEAFMIVGF